MGDPVTVTGMVDGLVGNAVLGWALDVQRPEPCVIEILTDAGEVIASARADRPRQDLSAYGFGRSDFAFRVSLPPLPGKAQWRVLADGAELSGSPLLVGAGLFDGAIRVAEGVAEGWVLERVANPPSHVVTIIDQDGAVLGHATAAAPTAAQADGFVPARFTLPLPPWAWRHKELGLRAFIGQTLFAATCAPLALKGHLDQLDHTRCAGWLLSPDAPTLRFPIELWSGDAILARGTADKPRDDLRDTYPDAWRSGFDLRIDPPLSELHAHEVTLRIAEGGGVLFDGPNLVSRRKILIPLAQTIMARSAELQLPAPQQAVLREAMAQFIKECRSDHALLERLPVAAMAIAPRPFRIVIPIYRDVETTRRCVESVLAHHGGAAGIVLINDASPDDGMAECLAAFATDPRVHLLTNATNRGFVQSVNRAIDFCGDGDVILLNSDTLVFAGGLAELSSIANTQDGIGTVTAMSNNATIFSYPVADQPCQDLADISWEELAATAIQYNAGKTIDVPTGHGFCILLTHTLLATVGKLDESFGRGYGEENDLCVRGADAGLRNVAAIGAFVQHLESISFGAEKTALLRSHLDLLEQRYPEYAGSVRMALESDDLRAGRWALDAVRLARWTNARSEHRFHLVIRNWLGGGTGKAIADIAASLGDHASVLELCAKPNGLMTLSATAPLINAGFASGETAELFRLLDGIRIEQVHVHQLLGFTAEFVRQLTGWSQAPGIRYHVHDFYPICPRVVLLDATQTFCGAPASDVCARCVEIAGAHDASRMQTITPAQHRQLFADILAKADVVAPSSNTAVQLRRVLPDLAIRVTPHPESAAAYDRPIREGSLTDILLIGAIGPHKGSALLHAVALQARLSAPQLRFHVLGHTDMDAQLARIGNVSISGPYAPAELAELVAAAGGRLALFLHGWPETFSYTLSEAVQLGLVPLVPEIGAPADRVRAAGFGHVFPTPGSATAIVQLLVDISEGRIDPTGGGSPADFIHAR